jgi:hypothetical protein
MALRSGLTCIVPAFVSRRPTSSEWVFTKELKATIELSATFGAADFEHKFLAAWNDACFDMLVRTRKELKIGAYRCGKGGVVVVCSVPPDQWVHRNENCTWLAQIANWPKFRLKIPIRALKLAQNLGQPCTIFVHWLRLESKARFRAKHAGTTMHIRDADPAHRCPCGQRVQVVAGAS